MSPKKALAWLTPVIVGAAGAAVIGLVPATVATPVANACVYQDAYRSVMCGDGGYYGGRDYGGYRGGCGGYGCNNGPRLVVQVLSDCWKPGYESYWGSRGQVWVPPGPGEIVERDGTVYRLVW